MASEVFVSVSPRKHIYLDLPAFRQFFFGKKAHILNTNGRSRVCPIDPRHVEIVEDRSTWVLFFGVWVAGGFSPSNFHQPKGCNKVQQIRSICNIKITTNYYKVGPLPVRSRVISPISKVIYNPSYPFIFGHF